MKGLFKNFIHALMWTSIIFFVVYTWVGVGLYYGYSQTEHYTTGLLYFFSLPVALGTYVIWLFINKKSCSEIKGGFKRAKKD